MTPNIQLSTGRYLDLVDPDPESFDADAVATSLAKACRFNGHCDGFYSVAQHCVLAARAFYGSEIRLHLARLALHHEDDEVGTGDISGPLKLLIGHALKPISQRIQQAAWCRFDIESDESMYRTVKVVDERLRVTEKRDLMPHGEEDDEPEDDEPFTDRLYAVDDWRIARAAWLAHWSYLMPPSHALGGPFCSRVLPMSSGAWREYDVLKYVTHDGHTRKAIIHRELVDLHLANAFHGLQHQGPLT